MTRHLGAFAPTLLTLALTLGGCAAELHGGEIAKGREVGGLPYRVRDRITMEVYQLGDGGYTKVGAGVDSLADPSRLFFLNFSGGALANANAKFEQRPDGTLTTVHLAGKQQATTVLTAAGDAVNSYATQRVADAKTRTDKATADLAAATAVAAKADTLVDLTYKAREADAKLSELDPAAKTSDRLEAERVAVEAKRAANAAAVKAGQSPPFPGV